MGQFKQMVKMMTTEPTVELKLKKGGTVKGHKCMKSGGKADASGHSYMNGGVSMALEGANKGLGPKRATPMPARPIVRQPGPDTMPQKGMAPKKPSLMDRYNKMNAKNPEKAMSFAERKGLPILKNQVAGGLKKGGDAMEALKKHEGKPASKAHKGLKTGGVVKGQGGYKTGGVVMGQGGYKDGGCATMKKGGSSKKYAEGGSVSDGGRPQKMPQGAKKPSSPVEISRLSGTFKKGGKVKKYAEGGMSDYEKYMTPEEQLKEMRMRKAMDEGYKGVAKRDTEANEALLDSLTSLPRSVKNMLKKAMRGQGAVTDTETTVSRTVVPAKKRGGKV